MRLNRHFLTSEARLQRGLSLPQGAVQTSQTYVNLPFRRAETPKLAIALQVTRRTDFCCEGSMS